MDSRLARGFAGAVLVAGLALAARQAPAQLTGSPPLGQPPAGPPPADNSPPPASVNESDSAIVASPRPPPTVNDAVSVSSATNAASNAPAAATLPIVNKPPPPPPGPPPPLRTPTAIMQVLDKVTAETLQFEAPLGRPIRYKTLVMTVRVCETRGAQDPQPRPSAYVVMETRAPTVAGHEPPPPKRVFDGWMFANAPALHALEHPIYDAWLVSCSAGIPLARLTPPPSAPAAAKPPAAKPPTAPAPSAPNTASKASQTKAPVAKSASPPLPDSTSAKVPADNASTPPE